MGNARPPVYDLSAAGQEQVLGNHTDLEVLSCLAVSIKKNRYVGISELLDKVSDRLTVAIDAQKAHRQPLLARLARNSFPKLSVFFATFTFRRKNDNKEVLAGTLVQARDLARKIFNFRPNRDLTLSDAGNVTDVCNSFAGRTRSTRAEKRD